MMNEPAADSSSPFITHHSSFIIAFHLWFRLRDTIKWIKLARRSIVKLGKQKACDEDFAGLFGERNGGRRDSCCRTGARPCGSRPCGLSGGPTEQPAARSIGRRHRFLAR